MKKLLVVAATALFPSFALAQTAQLWDFRTGYYLYDGGNAPVVPNIPLSSPAPSHGVQQTQPFASLPVIAFTTADWGTVVGWNVTGNDNAFELSFYTPSSGQGAVTANTAVFTFTTASAYSTQLAAVPDAGTKQNAGYICTYAGTGTTPAVGGTPGVSPYYVVQTGASAFSVVASITFTPAASTLYHFQCQGTGIGNVF